MICFSMDVDINILGCLAVVCMQFCFCYVLVRHTLLNISAQLRYLVPEILCEKKEHGSKLDWLDRALFIVVETVCPLTLFYCCCVALLNCLGLVHLLELFSFFVGLPLFGVLFRIGLQLLELGQNLAHQGKERIQNEIDEPWLT